MRLAIGLLMMGACTFSASTLTMRGGAAGGGPNPASTTTSSNAGDQGSAGEAAVSAPACDAAHDHCLAEDTWFALSFTAGQGPEQPIDAYPATWTQVEGDLPWLWGYRCQCTVGGYGVRAVPATRENLAVQRRVVVFFDQDGVEPRLPRDERSARSDEWRAGVVTSVEAAAGTFEMTGHRGKVPMATARVVVEMRERVPERPQRFPVPFQDPAP